MVPGPGVYEALGNTAEGNQMLSQFHTIQTRHFGSENQRPDWIKRFKTPGPGTYVPPSDFGYVTISPRERLN